MSEQALLPTNRCLRFGCDDALLVVNEQSFWVCPACKLSYGRDAKEGLLTGLLPSQAQPKITGWGINSLKSWKADLQKRHRTLMARRQRLEGRFHAEYSDLGHLIDISAKLIKIVDSALAESKDAAR